VKYVGCPPNSPLYDGVEHSVKVMFNTLSIGVNREAIATTLAFIDELTSAMDQL